MKTYAEAREELIRELALPSQDAYGQDWVAELPEDYRTLDHLGRYLAALAVPNRDPRERQLLVELALDVANDLVGHAGFEGAWARLAAELKAHRDLHEERIRYWSCVEDDLEDAFPLTPWVRALGEG